MKKIFAKILVALLPKRVVYKRQEVEVIEHKTFNDAGEFINAAAFEEIWFEEQKSDGCGWEIMTRLSDDMYLDYMIWKDLNTEKLYKKHLPNSRVFMGKNPNLIFHGGCLGCMSQRLYGYERCKGCMYFKTFGGKPDLRISGEESTKMTQEDLDKFLNGAK